jgi:ammonia channel protein AmtB
MEILWIAIVLYSAGLALVLHFRPALMFNEDGTWKEFGYQRSSRHTMLPFWLFVIVWAFMSYAIAASITWYFSAPAIGLSALTSASATFSQPTEEVEDEDEEEEDEETMMPVSEMSAPISGAPISGAPKRGPGRPRKEKPLQGYYVLEKNGDGLHRYIYYGPDSPPPMQVADSRLPNAIP